MTAYLNLELRRQLRDGAYLMISIVLPLALYLGLGAGKTPAELSTAMIGAAAFGAMGVAITSATGIAEDRAMGWLRQLRLTPLSPAQVVLGRGATTTVLAALPILLISILGIVINGVEMNAGQWIGVLLVLWIGVVPIALLGLGLGYLLSAQMAQIAGTIAYVGLTLLGGLFIPLNMYPSWLQSVAEQTPVYRYNELCSAIALGHTPSLAGLGVLVAWAAVFALLAGFAYRKGGKRA